MTNSTRRRGPGVGWAFALPGTLFLGLFLLIPLVLVVVTSFTDLNRQRVIRAAQAGGPWHLLTDGLVSFRGLDQYVRLFSDEDFRLAIWHNVAFTLTVVPLQTALALALAMLVNQNLRGRTVARSIFFLPVVVPMAVSGLVWKLLLDRNQGEPGLAAAFLRDVSFGLVDPDWMLESHWMQLAVLLVSMWASSGFQMVILLAALQDVPVELHEAAMVDGAGPWRRFRMVTIPAIRAPLFFVVTATAILSFRIFDQVYVLPSDPGGPVGATQTVMLFVQQIAERGDFARASAASLVLIVIVAVSTVVQRRLEPKD